METNSPPPPYRVIHGENWQKNGKWDDNPIYMSQSEDHQEILIQHEGTILLYRDVTVQMVEDTPPSNARQIISTILVFILGYCAIVFLPSQSLPTPTPTPAFAPPTTTNLTLLLRHQYFSFQQENMRIISPSLHYHAYEESTLSMIITHLTHVADLHPTPPSCLCHHHLDDQFSINGTYAPVCIIPLGTGAWQAVINPKAMSLDALYNHFKYPIIPRSVVREESWVFKADDRQRYNTFGFSSIWPSLGLHYYGKPLQVSWSVHDATAHCMALAVQEIERLLI